MGCCQAFQRGYPLTKKQKTLAPIVKGQTGVDPNGGVADAGFTIYLGNDGTIKNYGQPVWLDPDPQLGRAPIVPKGSDDFISIATHELFHCLGFASWPAVNAPWNQKTFQQNEIWYYSSPAILNLLGGPLPLAPGFQGQAGDHIGNRSIAYQPVTSDLMYEFGNYDNNRLDIGQLDLLILKDLGYTVHDFQNLPLVDPLDAFNLVGSSAADTLHVKKFSSMVSALECNDTIVLPSGKTGTTSGITMETIGSMAGPEPTPSSSLPYSLTTNWSATAAICS